MSQGKHYCQHIIRRQRPDGTIAFHLTNSLSCQMHYMKKTKKRCIKYNIGKYKVLKILFTAFKILFTFQAATLRRIKIDPITVLYKVDPSRGNARLPKTSASPGCNALWVTIWGGGLAQLVQPDRKTCIKLVVNHILVTQCSNPSCNATTRGNGSPFGAKESRTPF